MRRLRVLRRRSDEDIALVTDSHRLAQVFINLVTNARKYCDADQTELIHVAEVLHDALVRGRLGQHNLDVPSHLAFDVVDYRSHGLVRTRVDDDLDLACRRRLRAKFRLPRPLLDWLPLLLKEESKAL